MAEDQDTVRAASQLYESYQKSLEGQRSGLVDPNDEEYNQIMRIRVELIPEAGGAFSACCPELPGCASCGDSRDEALANVKEAIQLYLEPTSPSTPGAETIFVSI